MADTNATPATGGQEATAASIVFRIELDDTGMQQQFQEEAEDAASGMGSVFGDIFKANLWTMAISTAGEIWSTFSEGAEEAYLVAFEAETKLEQIMRKRLGATEEEIANIKALATELDNGIIGENSSMAAMQKLAMYVEETDAIGQLLPAIQNATAAQFGFNASAEDAADIGQRFGEALKGEAGGLEELGIFCTEAQAEILALGTEQEKVALLSELVAENMGDMNSALANTDYGKQVQLNNAFTEVQETVGEFMTIMKSNFADVMIEVVELLGMAADFAVGFAHGLGDILEAIGLKKKTEEIKEVNTELEDTEEELKEIEAIEEELAGFDDFNLLGSVSTDDLAEALDEFSDKSVNGNIEIDTSEAVEEIDHLTQSLSGFGDSFDELGSTIKGSSTFNIIGDFADLCIEQLNDAFYWIGVGITEIATVIVDTVKSIFEGFDWFFSETVSQISTTIGGFLEDGISGAWKAADDWEAAFQKRQEDRLKDRGHEDYKPGQLYLDVDRLEALFSGEYMLPDIGPTQLKLIENQVQQKEQQKESASSIILRPNIYIGNDQLVDYTIDGINEKSALKGYSVIK